MSNKNGGPAFPTAEFYDEKHVGTIFGMSLRDYFAGQALVACMSSPRWVEGLDISAAKSGSKFGEALAAMAFQYADAMLAERAKEQS